MPTMIAVGVAETARMDAMISTAIAAVKAAPQ